MTIPENYLIEFAGVSKLNSIWQVPKALLEFIAWIRRVGGVIAFFGSIFAVLGLIYVDYFDHREWATERLASYYGEVERYQGSVLDIAVRTIPSNATDDRLPTEIQKEELRAALIELSRSVSSVDVFNEKMGEVADQYQSSIAAFSGALARLDEGQPETYSELLRAADNWDKAAKSFSLVVEDRIQSYRSSLLPSS